MVRVRGHKGDDRVWASSSVCCFSLCSGHTIAQHIELNWKGKIFNFRVLLVLVAVDMSENKLLDDVVCRGADE